jgi:hypothetical protein
VDVARDEVRAFVERWHGRRVARDEIRAIDASVVERERLALILQARPR